MLKKLLFAFVLFTGTLQAQNGLGFGVLAGGNYATYEYVGDEEVFANYEAGVGYYFGAFFTVPLVSKLTFAPEVIYARQTVSAKGDLGQFVDNLFSMEVKAEGEEDLLLLPLMFRVKFYKFDVGLGPQVGYSLDRRITASTEGFSMDINDQMMEELFDYSDDPEDKLSVNLNADAGIYMTSELRLGLRYSYGLLLRDEVRTSVWQLGLTYEIL